VEGSALLRIGIDIGGTGAKMGVVDAAGRVVARSQTPTGRDLPAEELVARIAESVRELGGSAPLAGIGVAAPGMRRRDGEGVVNVTNLPHLDGYPLRSRIQEATGLPTVLDNDANAAAMGEFRFGGGQGAARLLVMTLGTGIGAGMVVGGAVHRVACEGLGDPGHVIVQRDGPRCGCGGRGCVETIASVPALMERACAAGVACGAFGDLVLAATTGDAEAESVLQEGGAWIGMALTTLIHVLAPDRVLVGGGGLDAAEDALMKPIRTSLFAHLQPFLAERLTLGRAALGNDAGLVGAAALVDPVR